MKTFVLVLTVILFSCFKPVGTNKDSFTLKGHIKGYGNGQVIISYSDPSVKIEPDTVTVKNDVFILKGSLVSPRMAFMKIMGNENLKQEFFRIDFILENSNILISADVQNIKEYTIAGSKSHEFYKKLSHEGNDINSAFRETRNAYYKAEKDSPEQKILEQELDQKREAYLNFLTSSEGFFKSHSGAYILWLFSDKVPWQRMKEILPSFDASLKNNIYLSYMVRKVEGADRSKPGSIAADFAVKDLDGNDYSLQSFKGNYLLVFFSASWCVPCKKEYPYLREAYKTYTDKGLKMITLNVDVDREKWEGDVKKENFPWPVLSDLTAFTGDLTKNYGVFSIPKVFLIDPQGKIVSNSIRQQEILDALEEVYSK